MTAVILAGGDGSRMRPLTCAISKAMLNVCNIPLIEYNVAALKRHNISDYIISADRFLKLIAEYFDTDRKDIPKLSFSTTPLGTSAALAQAVKEWDIPEKESVLVINGASLSDFDYTELLRVHKYGGNALTLVLKKSERPYDSIVAVENEGILKDIALCQPRESCVSDLVLTGTFVINAKLAAHIAEYGEDIYEKALPSLIKSGLKINAVTENGYFSFIRTPNDLIQVNSDVMTGLYPFMPDTVSLSDKYSTDNISRPICIGSNCDIDSSVRISGNAVIGNNVTIGKGTKIHGGIIGDGCYIGSHCKINEALIGRAVKISEGSSVFEGAVIGNNAVIEENAVVNTGVKVWNGRHIEPFACAASDIRYGFAKPVVIDDEGITGETNGIITPQNAAVIGSSMVSIGQKIGIGCKENSASYAIAMALTSGVMAAGGEAWFLGEVSEPELAYCIRICDASAGCYVDAGVTAKIKFFSADGLSITRGEEKIIEGGLNRGEYRRSGFMHFGLFRQCTDIRELYRNYLMKLRSNQLSGIKAVINTAGRRISETCELLLKNINDKDGEPIVFHISSDGTKISAYTEETGYVFHDRLMLLCCQQRFMNGKNVALPYNFPSAAEKLAEQYNCKVERYSGCSADGTDKTARQLAATADFAYDGIVLMLNVLKILSQRKCSLKKACDELPEFAAVNRFVALDAQKWHHMNILRELCSERQVCNDGIVINDKRGRVLIRPVKTGKGVMMHVESYAVEAASELCDFYQDTLNALAKKGLLK